MYRGGGGGGMHLLTFGVRRCAAQQGLIFRVQALELGIVFGLYSRTGYQFGLYALKMNCRYSFPFNFS